MASGILYTERARHNDEVVDRAKRITHSEMFGYSDTQCMWTPYVEAWKWDIFTVKPAKVVNQPC